MYFSLQRFGMWEHATQKISSLRCGNGDLAILVFFILGVGRLEMGGLNFNY